MAHRLILPRVHVRWRRRINISTVLLICLSALLCAAAEADRHHISAYDALFGRVRRSGSGDSSAPRTRPAPHTNRKLLVRVPPPPQNLIVDGVEVDELGDPVVNVEPGTVVRRRKNPNTRYGPRSLQAVEGAEGGADDGAGEKKTGSDAPEATGEKKAGSGAPAAKEEKKADAGASPAKEEKKADPGASPAKEGKKADSAASPAKEEEGDTEKKPDAGEGSGTTDDSDADAGGEENTAVARVANLKLKKEAKASMYYKMQREIKYMKKSIGLKKNLAQTSESQVELDGDEASTSATELKAIAEKQEDVTKKLKDITLFKQKVEGRQRKLLASQENMMSLTSVMSDRLQQLSVDEVLANSARGLPDSVAGAIRRSAEALTPFMDTLMIAADTNQRLVDHVGAEIDKYTHVNIRKSPFLSGVLFYCVLLVPAITIVAFVRRVISTSNRLTVSHFIIFGNAYFISMSACAILSTLFIKSEAAAAMHNGHQQVFATFNVFLALYYFWHVGILSLQSLYTRERRNYAQLVATISVGLHYFLFTWRRIFTNSSPEMLIANYCIYITIFSAITAERARRINFKFAPWQAITDLFGFNNFPLALKQGYSRIDAGKSPRTRRSTQQRTTHSDEERDATQGRNEQQRPSSARNPDSRRSRRFGRAEAPPNQRGGFMMRFFGSNDNATSNSDSEEDGSDENGDEEANTNPGWWGTTIGRATGNGNTAPAAPGAARERTNRAGRARRAVPTRAAPEQQQPTFYSSWFNRGGHRDR